MLHSFQEDALLQHIFRGDFSIVIKWFLENGDAELALNVISCVTERIQKMDHFFLLILKGKTVG